MFFFSFYESLILNFLRSILWHHPSAPILIQDLKSLISFGNAYNNLPRQCRSTMDSPWEHWENLKRCLPLLPKKLVQIQGRQSYAVPRSENQSHWISNEPFSGSETEESWAPLRSSSVYFIQRIMVVARNSSFGLKVLRSTFAHFYPRNRLELPYTNTALFSHLPPPQSKRGGIALEGYVPSAHFGGLTVDHLFSLSGLLPDLESSAELQGASPPGRRL